ncbi:hypothetical protein GGR54DRAFT_607316 [Hypoxylon sp. NC1633]|nr:hypothetical protein GGR54DRAFT_607316 [Hypoxylon sp. NC1633]
MIWRVDRIQYYYWGVVILIVVSYLFLISEAFILCHYFGIESLKCFDPSKDTLSIAMTGLVTGLDVLSDILIVSIPIIVLRRAKIQTSQKASLGIFLCLSIFMACLAIIRVSKIHGITGVDIIWEFFWQYMETTIAVLMGSLTVIRSLLIYQANDSGSPHDEADVSDTRFRMRFLRRHKNQTDFESQDVLPEVPSATLTGLRSFIRRNNRATIIDNNHGTRTDMSHQSTLADSDESYQLISMRKAIHPQEAQQGVHHVYQSSLPMTSQERATLQHTQLSASTSRTGTTLHEQEVQRCV